MNKYVFWNHIDNAAAISNLRKVGVQLSSVKTFNPCSGIAYQGDDNARVFIIESESVALFVPTDQVSYRDCFGRNAAEKILDDYISGDGVDFQSISEGVSLIIFHKGAGDIILSIDKFGSAQTFYTQSQNLVVISNQLSFITAVMPVMPEISDQAIYNFIDAHVIPSPLTIYREVYKIEPAQTIKFSHGAAHKSLYWLPEFSEENADPIDVLKERTRNTLYQSVRKNDVSDFTGAFLSGGLDSSTIAGFLSRSAGRTVSAYSMGFDESGYDETEYAKTAARHFGTNLKCYYVTPTDIANSFSKVVGSYDEPFGNSSAIPTYLCAKIARGDGISTLLAGDGGDELFAGNSRYAKQYLFERYSKIPASFRKYILDPVFLNAFNYTRIKPFSKIKSYIEQANTPMPDRLERYNFINYFSAEKIFVDQFLNEVDRGYPINEKRRAYNRPIGASMLNRMLYMEWKFTLADNDLVKVNKACELAGVNVRYPMLSDELVELSTKIPSRLKLKGQNLRYFYKESLRGFLPDEIINKTKHGFGLPFGEWLKKSPVMQEHIYDNLSSLKTRGYIRPEFIDHIADIHRTQNAASYYGTMVWILAVLQEWLESRSH